MWKTSDRLKTNPQRSDHLFLKLWKDWRSESFGIPCSAINIISNPSRSMWLKVHRCIKYCGIVYGLSPICVFLFWYTLHDALYQPIPFHPMHLRVESLLLLFIPFLLCVCHATCREAVRSLPCGHGLAMVNQLSEGKWQMFLIGKTNLDQVRFWFQIIFATGSPSLGQMGIFLFSKKIKLVNLICSATCVKISERHMSAQWDAEMSISSKLPPSLYVSLSCGPFLIFDWVLNQGKGRVNSTLLNWLLWSWGMGIGLLSSHV